MTRRLADPANHRVAPLVTAGYTVSRHIPYGLAMEDEEPRDFGEEEDDSYFDTYAYEVTKNGNVNYVLFQLEREAISTIVFGPDRKAIIDIMYPEED